MKKYISLSSLVFAILILLLYLFILCVTTTSGCIPPCQIKSTRCNQEVIEICGSNGEWQRVMDCSQVVPIREDAPKSWTCAEVSTVHTCIPKGKKK